MGFRLSGCVTMALVALAGGSLSAAPRRTVDLSTARTVESRGYSASTRAAASAIRGKNGTKQAASQYGQAPLLLQVYRLDNSYIGWAVATGTLPKGTRFTLIVRAQDGQQIQNRTFEFDDDLQPGQSFRLPDFRDFSVFWTPGLMAFDVFVDGLDGSTTHCAVDFAVGRYLRSPAEIREIVPLIRTATWEHSGDGPVLVVNGFFADSEPHIALDDLVVPSSAITSRDATTIRIQLNQVPNYYPEDLRDYLLTVAQAGWADTLPVRNIP